MHLGKNILTWRSQAWHTVHSENIQIYKKQKKLIYITTQTLCYETQNWAQMHPVSINHLWDVTTTLLESTCGKYDWLGKAHTCLYKELTGRVLDVPNIFHLRMMATTVFGDLQCCRNVLVPFPRSVPQHNPVLELYGHYLWPHVLIFALACTVNCGTIYGQVCAFPNHVQSIEFTTGVLQSSCRNISRMVNGNRMHLSSILSRITILL